MGGWASIWSAGRCALLCLAALGVSPLGGCVSLTYTDRQNVRHVVGFVDVAVDEGAAGRMVAATTLGLALTGRTADGSGVALGYNRTTYLALGEDACVDIGRAGPCSTLTATRVARSGGYP